MSIGSDVFSSGRFRDTSGPEDEQSLFNSLTRASRFAREFRTKLRHGELSRAPLKMIRFQVEGASIQCDWMARAPDPWDSGLSTVLQLKHTSLQTLKDAMNVRALLFDVFPYAESAEVRIFREYDEYRREIVMVGLLHRNDNSARTVQSLAMRAKILGFRFHMEGDILRNFKQ